MSASNQQRPGFWGTFRSYLVAGALVSALVGVLGLYPVLTILMTSNPAAAAVGAHSLSIYIVAVLHPTTCFLAPLFAYIDYRQRRNVRAVIALMVPLVVTIVFALLVYSAEDYCGGRFVC